MIMLVLPTETILSAYDKITSEHEHELDRTYHLQENGYMLDNGEFVRVSFSFVVKDSSIVEKLSKGRPFIKHTITKVLSGSDRNEFRGNEGLKWFENEIKSDLNDSFSDINIEQVYITGIVIS